jgi:hypothetical protein
LRAALRSGFIGTVGTADVAQTRTAAQAAKRGLHDASPHRALAWLRNRYDAGAVAPAVYATIKKLERNSPGVNAPSITDSRANASNPATAQRKGENAMGTKEQYGFGSRFLKAEDMAGKTATVTISAIEDVEFDDRGLKPVLHFHGKKKGLVTNSANFDTLAAAISPRTEDWVGHAIVLKGEKVRFKGRLVDSIVVSVPAPVKQEAKQQPDDLDDGIPDFAA